MPKHSRAEAPSTGGKKDVKLVTVRSLFLSLWLIVLLGWEFADGQGLGTLRGSVKDPTGALLPQATVTLNSAVSARTQSIRTESNGTFILNGIPFGEYILQVEHAGFSTLRQPIQIIIGSAPYVELTLPVSSATTTVEVTLTSPLEVSAPTASSPPVMVSSEEITEQLPGADRMSSLAFVTETTPGAFVLHDHLHVRGGHQINWMINGVPVPNTNMSSNVGRAMDPQDIEEVQINRGGYGAQSGDRTFAQVNMFTRSGFDSDNDADVALGFGSQGQSNDQVSYGGHTKKFAHYFSLSANRTDLGLEPPVETAGHNMGSGEGFLTTMTYDAGPMDKLDMTATFRNDRDQVPVDPLDTLPTDVNYEGNRDVDEEQDSFATVSWNHTINPNLLLTVSPVFHLNDSRYISSPNDPLPATSKNFSTYIGNQTELKYVRGKNNLVGGIYGFYQQTNLMFGLLNNARTCTGDTCVPDCVPSGASVCSEFFSAHPNGGVGSAYLNDEYQPWRWLTLNGGVRLTHFSGITNENAANPRAGATIMLPKINWVMRGFYGTYYQPPPLYTVSGGFFSSTLIGSSGFGYSTLKGERDIQREFGLTIPYRGWVFDFDHFGTNSRDFLDHDMLGDSNILLPLTTPDARIRGTEVVVRSPEMLQKLAFHLAFSNMMAEYRGAPSGGLIEPMIEQCIIGYCYLDHDQRNTLTTGFDFHLPWQTFFSNNVLFGSGVVNSEFGENDLHCPAHTAADAELGKSFGDGKVKVSFSVINVSNARYALSYHNEFAGTHENNPREIIGSVRYHFHL